MQASSSRIAALEAELAVTMEVAQPSSKVPVAGIADHVDGWGDFDVPMGGTAATSAREMHDMALVGGPLKVQL